MTKLEEIARALYIGPPDEPPHTPWEILSVPVRSQFLAAAKFAVEAMREPNTRMIGMVAQGRYLHLEHERPQLIEAWENMIDAVLTEKPE